MSSGKTLRVLRKTGWIALLTLAVLLAIGEALTIFLIPDLLPMAQPDADLGFRFRPNTCRTLYCYLRLGEGVLHYCTGARGQRAPAAGEQPANNRPVIACFGDSHTWGDGLNAEQTYPGQLGALLPAHEVLNFGMTSYNAHQALAAMKRYFAASTPAVVIYQLCVNDDSAEYFLTPTDHIPPTGVGRLLWLLLTFKRHLRTTTDAAHAIQDAAELCRQKETPLLLYFFGRPPSVTDAVLEPLRRQGVCVLDGQSIPFRKEHEIRLDGHLSERGNARLAGALVDAMTACRMLAP